MKLSGRIRMAGVAAPLLACAVTAMGAEPAAVGDTQIDDTQITGYYAVMGEEYSLLIPGNDVIYSLDTDPDDLERIEGFRIYGTEDAFLIVHDEGTALYFQRQTQKERTPEGGIYYAGYEDYIGSVDEVEFDEGTQIEVNGHIFSNDYHVVLRQPLAVFYHLSEDAE